LYAVKNGKKYRTEWNKGIKDFRTTSKDRIGNSHIIYMGSDRMKKEGVNIWPVDLFLRELFEGNIL